MISPRETWRSKPDLRFSVPWVALSYLVIGLAVLLPRVWDLAGFVTADEVNFWIRRSETFLQLLQSGNFGAMTVSDHPGVTTVWLGAGGILLHDTLLDWGVLPHTSFATRLALMQLPVALVNSGAILLGYCWLRRLLPATMAALAALLWAADPFVIGYSRLLHVDALAATFITLSLLAACCYRRDPARLRFLVASGVCAGLAILSKSPALALLPAVALALLLAETSDQHQGRQGDKETKRQGDKETTASDLPVAPSPCRPVAVSGSLAFVLPLLLWCAICAATVFVLWPALWVNLAAAYKQVRRGVVTEGALPHAGGNFFLGQSDPAPGLLFYPVALALRLMPWTMLGLLLLPLAWWRVRSLATARRDLVVLAAFVVLFVVVMSVFPKKFNRYLVLAFPTIDILAAAGLVWASESLRPWTRRLAQWATGLVALVALANVAYFHPYYLAYFNQALGGPQAGARAFTIGWGEGLEQAAAWLNAQPDITGVLTASSRPDALQPYMRPGGQVAVVHGGVLPDRTGYVVLYVRDVQDQVAPPYDQFYGRVPPVYTVRIHGVEYAWIYQAPPAVPQPHPADFGDAIHLRGFELSGAARPGRQADLRLFWETRAAPAANATLFVHLIGPGGRHFIQLDLPYPTGEWGAHQFKTTHVPLAIPADAPAGRYQLVVGLYDPASGQRLALTSPAPIQPELDGPDAFMLTQMDLKSTTQG